MRRSRSILNQQSLLILYYSFVLPYLSYCVEVWGNTYKTNLLPLYILQKRAIRTVFNARIHDHTNLLFLKASALKFFDLVKFKTAQIIYKVNNNLLPNTIKNLFQERDSCRKYVLRGKLRLKQQRVRSTLKRMCISVEGVILWNSLDSEVKLSKNVNQFKRKFRKGVFEIYNREEKERKKK